MTLFDFIFGRKHNDDFVDDHHACERERGAIAERLRAKGLLEGDKPARIYLQYDEITPEIITCVRLQVGYELSYVINIPTMEERAEVAYLLEKYSFKYEQRVELGSRR